MESIVKQNLLYDFYGELLTEHQKSIYEDVIFRDLSMGEIAEERGISRQGVHDLVKRCDHLLAGYEEKLHLVQKFQETKAMVGEIRQLVRQFAETGDPENIRRIECISDEIIEL